jgi:hypothetical protein
MERPVEVSRALILHAQSGVALDAVQPDIDRLEPRAHKGHSKAPSKTNE